MHINRGCAVYEWDKDQTDLKRIKLMSDKNIDVSDFQELDENFFKNAKVIMPSEKKHLSLRLDADVLAWFKSQGKGYQGRINIRYNRTVFN